ncbi:nitrilase-related carbon-nitrogen hydrolase [Rhodospirillaceae bacterium SYSU D60014]|uniref:nitrilase-related carbon-nitrogen hydrolase n=1 Tax=Virgifigura deserti TaxID=2268457 RepID=UPI000E672941
MELVTVALWATNLAAPLNGIDAWAAQVDAQMAEAKAAGAKLLVMPEYASEQWLSFAPAGLTIDREIAWMAEQGEAALAAVAPLVRKHDMALLAGSMPVADGGGNGTAKPRNRAWLILPDGRMIGHDKLVLTPGEKDPKGWDLGTGDRVTVVEWAGLRLAMLICLDIEMPALASRLAPLDLDLILVPSMTAQRSGYHRVFDCAKARAVELQTVVCAVGAIGAPAVLQDRRETNCSGAAVFLPCEPVLDHSGVADRIGPWDAVEGPGPMLIARDLPVGLVRRLRQGDAEVWPGAWSAEHIVIEDPSNGAQ